MFKTPSPPTLLDIHAVCEKMWKNIVQSDRPQMTIWHMLFACSIHKATNTYFLNVKL